MPFHQSPEFPGERVRRTLLMGSDVSAPMLIIAIIARGR